MNSSLLISKISIPCWRRRFKLNETYPFIYDITKPIIISLEKNESLFDNDIIGAINHLNSNLINPIPFSINNLTDVNGSNYTLDDFLNYIPPIKSSLDDFLYDNPIPVINNDLISAVPNCTLDDFLNNIPTIKFSSDKDLSSIVSNCTSNSISNNFVNCAPTTSTITNYTLDDFLNNIPSIKSSPDKDLSSIVPNCTPTNYTLDDFLNNIPPIKFSSDKDLSSIVPNCTYNSISNCTYNSISNCTYNSISNCTYNSISNNFSNCDPTIIGEMINNESISNTNIVYPKAIELKYKFPGEFKINFSLFYERFNEICKVWLYDFPWTKFKNVCFTGGSLISCLDEGYDQQNLTAQDLDLFIKNDDNMNTSKEIIEYFLLKFKGKNLYLSQKYSVIMLYLEDHPQPLQIMSTSYNSFYDIVSNFDLSGLNLWYSDGGLQIPYNTYFELMYGFMILRKPTSPDRLFKYLKRGFKIVSYSCFTSDRSNNGNSKFYTNNNLDLVKLLSDRNLIMQYGSYWYPSSDKSPNNNIYLLSKFLENPTENISLNTFINNNKKKPFISGYPNVQNKHYHTGDILSFNPNTVDIIPIQFISEWSKKITTNNTTLLYRSLKPIIFWISGKVIYHEKFGILLDIHSNNHPLLRSIDELIHNKITQIPGFDFLSNIKDYKILKRYNSSEFDSLNECEHLVIKVRRYKEEIEKLFSEEIKDIYLTMELYMDNVYFVYGKLYVSPKIRQYKQYFPSIIPYISESDKKMVF